MIYCYSATGNTRFAARYLAERLHTEVCDILKAPARLSAPEGDEPIGVMFPIYCWGIPPVVSEFLEKLIPLVSRERYVWGVCTCGDEAGTAMRRFDELWKNLRGRETDAIYSLQMPNTYVMLPGFDTDSREVEERKLKAAPGRLDVIAAAIESHTTPVYDVQEGSLPALRSAIFPVFRKWGVTVKWWHVSDKCISCGKCAAICPARNIELREGRPVWGERCFSCCACYHCCPEKAISYARFTKGKKQYLCPLK